MFGRELKIEFRKVNFKLCFLLEALRALDVAMLVRSFQMKTERACGDCHSTVRAGCCRCSQRYTGGLQWGQRAHPSGGTESLALVVCTSLATPNSHTRQAEICHRLLLLHPRPAIANGAHVPGTKRDPSRDAVGHVAAPPLLHRRVIYFTDANAAFACSDKGWTRALSQTGVIFIREPSICFCIYTQRQPAARLARGPVIVMYNHAWFRKHL